MSEVERMHDCLCFAVTWHRSGDWSASPCRFMCHAASHSDLVMGDWRQVMGRPDGYVSKDAGGK